MLAMVWGLTHGHDPGVSRWAWVAVAAFPIPPGRPASQVARPLIPGGGGHSARSWWGGGGVCRYNGLPSRVAGVILPAPVALSLSAPGGGTGSGPHAPAVLRRLSVGGALGALGNGRALLDPRSCGLCGPLLDCGLGLGACPYRLPMCLTFCLTDLRRPGR